MIPTLIGISMIAFMIIQLPPGDYLTSLLASMADSGQTVDPAQMARMREIYGLDDPLWRPVLEVDLRHHLPRRLRLVVRMGAAGLRADLGAHGRDAC